MIDVHTYRSSQRQYTTSHPELRTFHGSFHGFLASGNLEVTAQFVAFQIMKNRLNRHHTKIRNLEVNTELTSAKLIKYNSR